MLTPNQKKWLEALESGEFKQTRGKLEDENGFCCLGVACVLAEKDGVQLWRKENDPFIWGGSLQDQLDVIKWLGIRDDTGAPKTRLPTDNLVALTSLNDDCEWNFKQIAEHIRKHPEEYFVDPEPSDNETA